MIKKPTPLKYCNCANEKCKQELLGDSCKAWYESLSEEEKESYKEPLAGRLGGRPYCRSCLDRAIGSGRKKKAKK